MKVGAAQTVSMGVGKGDGARFMHLKYKVCLGSSWGGLP